MHHIAILIKILTNQESFQYDEKLTSILVQCYPITTKQKRDELMF